MRLGKAQTTLALLSAFTIFALPPADLYTTNILL